MTCIAFPPGSQGVELNPRFNEAGQKRLARGNVFFAFQKQFVKVRPGVKPCLYTTFRGKPEI